MNVCRVCVCPGLVCVGNVYLCMCVLLVWVSECVYQCVCVFVGVALCPCLCVSVCLVCESCVCIFYC